MQADTSSRAVEIHHQPIKYLPDRSGICTAMLEADAGSLIRLTLGRADGAAKLEPGDGLLTGDQEAGRMVCELIVSPSLSASMTSCITVRNQ